jgi:hypothetical protein
MVPSLPPSTRMNSSTEIFAEFFFSKKCREILRNLLEPLLIRTIAAVFPRIWEYVPFGLFLGDCSLDPKKHTQIYPVGSLDSPIEFNFPIFLMCSDYFPHVFACSIFCSLMHSSSSSATSLGYARHDIKTRAHVFVFFFSHFPGICSPRYKNPGLKNGYTI